MKISSDDDMSIILRLSIPFITGLVMFLAAASASVASEARYANFEADKTESLTKEGKYVFIGNAKMSKGDDYINADTIIVSTKDKEGKSLVATGSVGQQVIFFISGSVGSGNHLTYDNSKDLIEIVGNGSISSDGSTFRAEHIIYNLKTKKLMNDESKSRIHMKISL